MAYTRTLILGLGNTLLRDDGVAIYAVRKLREQLGGTEGLDLVESAESGLALLDLIIGYDRVIILDALPAAEGPFGRLKEIRPEEWGETPLASSPHYTGLPSLLEMGNRLGYAMPEIVRVFAIIVKDPFSFAEELSPEVAENFDLLLQEIRKIIAAEA